MYRTHSFINAEAMAKGEEASRTVNPSLSGWALLMPLTSLVGFPAVPLLLISAAEFSSVCMRTHLAV